MAMAVARFTSSTFDPGPTTRIIDAALPQLLRLLRFLWLDSLHGEANQRVQRTGANPRRVAMWMLPVADSRR